METIKELSALFLEKGISLKAIGADEYAFSYTNILAVIAEIERLAIPILGGDVLIMCHGKFEYTGDSWYYDRQENELISEYVKRSIQHARDYIKNYHERNNNTLSFFSIVVDIKYA